MNIILNYLVKMEKTSQKFIESKKMQDLEMVVLADLLLALWILWRRSTIPQPDFLSAMNTDFSSR